MARLASADPPHESGRREIVTSLDVAGLLREYGGWGLSAILMGVIAKQYADNKALSGGHIERLITGLTAATQAAGGVQSALNELRALIDASGKTIGDHTHQIGILIEKVQHGFGNTSQAMQGVTSELQRIRDDRRERAERGRS
ncbi:hypothetical protein MPPM_4745 [Methylorubrum populi]|uniref:Uncharacterized protein n=1 Tax=Methylorubrum populi TaxID=223967 RepID=A0A160PMT8_9HYPH|nr:hypothetical protein [Methylobacterium sp. DB1607]BAU93350.1 hypothetical protein MPPM_4745 [Methylorubrum populi]